jgi:hypothetical protein
LAATCDAAAAFDARLERFRGGGRLAMDASRRGRARPGRREADRRGTAGIQIGADHLPTTGRGAQLIWVNA